MYCVSRECNLVQELCTIRQARMYARALFQDAPCLRGQNTPLLDADLILSKLLAKPRAWILAHQQDEIASVAHEFKRLVHLRCRGRALAYLTREKEFFGLRFRVTRATLIPKPDTELLVESVLAHVASQMMKPRSVSVHKDTSALPVLKIFEACTGCGCIAIALMHMLRARGTPPLYVIASDICMRALAVARYNARRLLDVSANSRVRFVHADVRAPIPFFSPSEGTDVVQERGVCVPYDVICANPPYVPSAQARALLQDGRGEPLGALDGGADGLDLVRAFAHHSAAALKEGGCVFCEVGSNHAQRAARIFQAAGFATVKISKDLSGKERLISGILRSQSRAVTALSG